MRLAWFFASLSAGLLLTGCPPPSDSLQSADAVTNESQGARAGQPGAELAQASKDQPDLSVSVSHDVTIALDPAPTKEGGNLFMAGFIEIDEAIGAPHEGAFPDHYLPAAIWVSDFPWSGKLGLVPGLHYFARYGHSALPQPGDRVSEPLTVPGSADKALAFVVQGRPKMLTELGRRIDAGVPEERPDGTLSPFRAPPGQETLDVPFVISLGDGLEKAPGPYRIAVVGFSATEGSLLPAANQEPDYLWAGQPSEATFPRSVTLSIPKELTVLIFASIGEGFSFDESVLRGAFLPPTSSVEGTVNYALDERGGSQGGKGSRPRIEADPEVAYEPVSLTIDLGSNLRKLKPSGQLLVIGTRSGPEGRDSQRPAFYWSSEGIYSRWPTKLDIMVPSDLDVRILLDQNGNMTPDAGDVTGEILPMFEAPESAVMTFVLDRPYKDEPTRDLEQDPFPGSSR